MAFAQKRRGQSLHLKGNTTTSNTTRGVCEVGSYFFTLAIHFEHKGRLFLHKSSVDICRQLESPQQRWELWGLCKTNSCLDGVRVIRVYVVGMIVLYYSARISTCGGSLLFWRVHSGSNSCWCCNLEDILAAHYFAAWWRAPQTESNCWAWVRRLMNQDCACLLSDYWQFRRDERQKYQIFCNKWCVQK